MQILAVDTSGVSGSVALIRDNAILSEVIINIGLNHSQTILPAMAQVLESSGVDASAVDLFAVTTGPGSFTGLRIGISLIKGLALSVSKPIAAVSTLDALAMNLFAAGSTICPFIDAKRGQVYTGLYTTQPDGYPVELRPATVEDPRNYLESINSEIVLTGSGTAAYASLIKEILGEKGIVAPPQMQLIRASSVAFLAMKSLERGDLADVMTLTPQYVRPSEFI